MTIPLNGLAVEAYSGLISLISKPRRGIARPADSNGVVPPDIVADATLEETHLDQMQITDHPTQYGAVISDHSFRMPSEVILTYGWSLSGTSISGALSGFAAFINGTQLSGNNKLNKIYEALLELQKNRVVFTVYTGRRMYPNMMLKIIALTTDKDTENAMIVKATCREIIFAQTRTAPTLLTSTQAAPQETASPTAMGQQSLSFDQQYNPIASTL